MAKGRLINDGLQRKTRALPGKVKLAETYVRESKKELVTNLAGYAMGKNNSEA